MTDSKLGARLELLEVRYAHQEASLEELTRTLLNQEQQIRALTQLTGQLEAQFMALAPSGTGSSDEQPPPHY